MSGIYSLLSAGRAYEHKVENSANNLANADTAGYKEDQLSFQEVLSTATRVPPESEEESFLSHEYLDMFVGKNKSAVQVAEVGKNFRPGPMNHTNKPLDMAIQSEGFFTVDTPFGERFTRAGQFTLNGQGELITQEGHKVMGENGPVTIRGNEVIVDENGGIMVDGQRVDRLKVVKFRDPTRLQKLGKNFFAPVDNDNVPIASQDIRVQQGVVESSNVNTVKELTRMIEANRAYEGVQKALTNVDRMNEQAISLVRG